MDTEKMIKRIQLLSLSCGLKTEEGIRHFHCGHEYVEIGGLKWATVNVGAEKPTDCGLYFQWGDTQGYTASQMGYSREGEKYFGWSDYKHGNGRSFPGFKDVTKYNDTDGKTVLDLEDDAVRANWGDSWRMPTEEEFQTLLDTTTYKRVVDYQDSGINGYLFVDKTDKTKKLFFPAVGFAYYGGMCSVGSVSSVWSSSLGSDGLYSAWGLYLNGVDWSIHISSFNRNRGFSVRGVVGG